LEFKNIILEEKLSNKLKNSHENFSGVRLPCKSLDFMVLEYPSKKAQNYGNHTPEKFLLLFFSLLDNFSSKMMFLNYKKSFQRMGPDLAMRSDLKVSRLFLFTDLTQTRGNKKIPKTVLKTRLKTKETTYTLFFENTLLSLSEATQQEHFLCFWKIY
jgi:hypothetical protein